jgi:hypothetical protein
VVVVVVVSLVVVLIVVSVVLRATDVVDVDFLLVLLPVPFVSAVLAVGRVVRQVRKRDPVQLDLAHPFEPVSAGPILLFYSFEEGFQHEWPAAQEDVVVLEEYLEGFACDLAIEQEVLVVEDEEDGGGARLEVLQITAFDA